MVVSLINPKLIAGLPPISTDVTPVKLAPVITMSVLPDIGPEIGSTLLTTGAGVGVGEGDADGDGDGEGVNDGDGEGPTIIVSLSMKYSSGLPTRIRSP